MISEQDRQEFVSAVAATKGARELSELIGEQQGGHISSLTDSQAKRILDAHTNLGRVVRRIAEKNRIFPAFDFQERIYAIALPHDMLVIIEKDKIEKID